MTDGLSRWVENSYSQIFPSMYTANNPTPSSHPTINYILTSNGDGTVSWLTNSSGLLTELSDTTITAVTDGELLISNGASWINQTFVEAGISALIHTHTENEIIDLGTYLLVDGTRNLTGNMLVDAGITIDGVDLSVFKSSYDIHIADNTIHYLQSAISITESQISDFSSANYLPLTGGTMTGGINANAGLNYRFRNRGDLGLFESNYSLALFASNNLIFSIDANANDTTSYFAVTHDEQTFTPLNFLFKITENTIYNYKDIDVTGNIIVSGLVDGVDLNAFKGLYDSHIIDNTIHFTQSSINHTLINNIGTNTHAQIDTHITSYNSHITNASAHHTKYVLTDDLTSGEITQLKNINTVTISNTQWGALGSFVSSTIPIQQDIDDSIATHTAIASAHHAKYTSAEVRSAMFAKGELQGVLYKATAISTISSDRNYFYKGNVVLFNATGNLGGWNIRLPSEIPSGKTYKIYCNFFSYLIGVSWDFYVMASAHQDGDDMDSGGNNLLNAVTKTLKSPSGSGYIVEKILLYSGTTPRAGDTINIIMESKTATSWISIRSMWVEWS